MTEPTDNNFPPPPEDATAPSVPDHWGTGAAASQPDPAASPANPISYVPHSSESAQPYRTLSLPADLQVPWSWVHFLFFLLSSIASFVALPALLALGIQAYSHNPKMQFQQLATNASF